MLRLVVTLPIVLLALSWPARAVEPLTAGELRGYCAEFEARPDAGASRLCLIYIKGFLDGAIATDARVAENVVNEVERDETFSERAFRTRVSRRLREFGPSVYAEFCVGTPVPVAEVVEHVVRQFDGLKNEALDARSFVYAALRENYPCAAGTE